MEFDVARRWDEGGGPSGTRGKEADPQPLIGPTRKQDEAAFRMVINYRPYSNLKACLPVEGERGKCLVAHAICVHVVGPQSHGEIWEDSPRYP